MILTKEELYRDWWAMFLYCKATEVAEDEVLALFSQEPDEGHEWSEQYIFEQMREIFCR